MSVAVVTRADQRRQRIAQWRTPTPERKAARVSRMARLTRLRQLKLARQKRPKPVGTFVLPLALAQRWVMPDMDVHRLLVTRGGMTIPELAATLHLDRHVVQRAVHRLEAHGAAIVAATERIGQLRRHVWAAKKAA